MENSTSGTSQPGEVGGYWGWLNVAKTQALEIASKAQVIAAEAGKVAQEKAVLLAKHAQEIRESYDLEVATSMFLGAPAVAPTSTGLPPDRPIESIRLTKADLAQLDMVYVTENLIAMGFPRDLRLNKMRSDGEDVECNDINIVAAYLRKRHNGRFMIWNISEESYDYSKFSDQVLEYKFPGHPAPPLGLLFKICTSVESWLDADDKNVAAVHCLTGKGRTATLLACILTWLGEFDSPMQALQYVAQRKNTVVDYLTIPSQRRYIQYFSNLLDGVKPNSEPLLLRRIIINAIPTFGVSPDSQQLPGCCPYIQLFKNGKLVASAAVERENLVDDSGLAGLESAQNRQLQLKWVNSGEGSASFQLDCLVQGDILLRCRHAAQTGARISMFRAAFHTGYISGGVLRLTKAQCDGSANDTRFSDDFFIDLIFASAVESQHINSPHEAALSDKYETGLHKDARFWESIAARKNKSKKRKSRKFLENQTDSFSISDDANFFNDQDERTVEVDFTGSSASASATTVANLSVPPKAKSYIDEDLIKQLAQLETDSIGESSGVVVSSEPSSGSITVAGTEAEDNATGGTENTDFLVVDRKVTSATRPSLETTAKQPATPTSSGAGNDLFALEELERELGLSDLQLFSAEKKTPSQSTAGSAVSTATKAPASSSVLDDEDNLDELEKYLESLSVPK